MANRIAFLSRLPPIAILRKKYGIDYFQHYGFEIAFLDLSFLLEGGETDYLYRDQDGLTECKVENIRSLGKLAEFVRTNCADTIFIDLAFGIGGYDYKGEGVFRVLKKYKVKYYVVWTGLLPNPLNSLSVSGKAVHKIKQAMRPNALANFLIKKSIVILAKMCVLYPKPSRIFGIPGGAMEVYRKRVGADISALIPINSMDYDDYLKYLASAKASAVADETCVFLDEDHTNHPDFRLGGVAPLDEAEYCFSMNRYFDQVEKMTGLSVVIAAHPKSSFTDDNNPYQGRRFVKGRTVDLVARCKLVIAHSSTSISFPVLFRKPLILVVTKEMKARAEMLNAVKAFALELGVKPIYVDSEAEFQSFSINLNSRPDYKNYLHKYVKSPHASDKPMWEIVAATALADFLSN